jgi:hypothetical protein
MKKSTPLFIGLDDSKDLTSKTPRRAGDRIKNDRRDAVTLARLHRAGELSPVWGVSPSS